MLTSVKWTDRKGNSTESSLCWNCKNAVKPWVCPWVDTQTPVKGWTAKPVKVGHGGARYDSYQVIECPKFHRDGFLAGTEQDLFGKRERISLDESDVVRLAEGIIEAAVEDWKYLEYGTLERMRYMGGVIERDEVLTFFFSKWFEALLQTFSDRSPEQIRSFIQITPSMEPTDEVKAKVIKKYGRPI